MRKIAEQKGLLRENDEKSNCGFGFLADTTGKKSHNIVKKALGVLKNLTHRAAIGSDGVTGDGAGIMI